MEKANKCNKPKRILGIVAHPDDEIGMVGTLRNHSIRDDKVFLAWMTRGELSSLFNPEEYSTKEAAAIRTEQAEKTARLVGAQAIFLDYPDSNVPASREAALNVAQLIRKTRPTAIITWNPLTEGHPDHRKTGKLVLDAIAYARVPRLIPELPAYRPPYGKGISVYVYDHPTDPTPKIFIDISDQMKVIDKVIQVYEDIFPMDISDWKYRIAKSYGKASDCEFAEMFRFKRYKGTFASLVRDGSEMFGNDTTLPPDNKAIRYLI